MSIRSGIGAASATSEIITLIDKLIEEQIVKLGSENIYEVVIAEDIIIELKKVRNKAQSIKEAGDSGWY